MLYNVDTYLKLIRMRTADESEYLENNRSALQEEANSSAAVESKDGHRISAATCYGIFLREGRTLEEVFTKTVIDKDEKQAVVYLKRGVEQNCPLGHLLLGLTIVQGEPPAGIPKEISSLEGIGHIARGLNILEHATIPRMFLDDQRCFVEESNRYKEDAYKFLRTLSAQNDVLGCLARFVIYDCFIKKDKKNADGWLQWPWKQSYKMQLFAAIRAIEGCQESPDVHKAAAIFASLQDANVPSLLFNIMQLRAFALSPTQPNNPAYFLVLEYLASRGNKEAGFYLGRAYLQGLGTPTNLVYGIHWLRTNSELLKSQSSVFTEQFTNIRLQPGNSEEKILVDMVDMPIAKKEEAGYQHILPQSTDPNLALQTEYKAEVAVCDKQPLDALLYYRQAAKTSLSAALKYARLRYQINPQEIEIATLLDELHQKASEQKPPNTLVLYQSRQLLEQWNSEHPGLKDIKLALKSCYTREVNLRKSGDQLLGNQYFSDQLLKLDREILEAKDPSNVIKPTINWGNYSLDNLKEEKVAEIGAQNKVEYEAQNALAQEAFKQAKLEDALQNLQSGVSARYLPSLILLIQFHLRCRKKDAGYIFIPDIQSAVEVSINAFKIVFSQRDYQSAIVILEQVIAIGTLDSASSGVTRIICEGLQNLQGKITESVHKTALLTLAQQARVRLFDPKQTLQIVNAINQTCAEMDFEFYMFAGQFVQPLNPTQAFEYFIQALKVNRDTASYQQALQKLDAITNLKINQPPSEASVKQLLDLYGVQSLWEYKSKIATMLVRMSLSWRSQQVSTFLEAQSEAGDVLASWSLTKVYGAEENNLDTAVAMYQKVLTQLNPEEKVNAGSVCSEMERKEISDDCCIKLQQLAPKSNRAVVFLLLDFYSKHPTAVRLKLLARYSLSVGTNDEGIVQKAETIFKGLYATLQGREKLEIQLELVKIYLFKDVRRGEGREPYSPMALLHLKELLVVSGEFRNETMLILERYKNSHSETLQTNELAIIELFENAQLQDLQNIIQDHKSEQQAKKTALAQILQLAPIAESVKKKIICFIAKVYREKLVPKEGILDKRDELALQYSKKAAGCLDPESIAYVGGISRGRQVFTGDEGFFCSFLSRVTKAPDHVEAQNFLQRNKHKPHAIFYNAVLKRGVKSNASILTPKDVFGAVLRDYSNDRATQKVVTEICAQMKNFGINPNEFFSSALESKQDTNFGNPSETAFNAGFGDDGAPSAYEPVSCQPEVEGHGHVNHSWASITAMTSSAGSHSFGASSASVSAAGQVVPVHFTPVLSSNHSQSSVVSSSINPSAPLTQNSASFSRVEPKG